MEKKENSEKGRFMQNSAYQTLGNKVYKLSSQNVKLDK